MRKTRRIGVQEKIAVLSTLSENVLVHLPSFYRSEVNLGVERSGLTLVRYHKGISEHDQYVRVIL